MRDLAPSVVTLIKPENELAIRAREWGPTRENLLLVIYGDGTATPLF
jgi:hypothetical protein